MGHRVESVEGSDGDFRVHTRDEQGIAAQFAAKKIVVATGYYDLPNRLGVPGEDLPHVSHYYTEPHPFWQQDVVVIGGKNSAAEAALDLYRSGANVTLVHRRPNWAPRSNIGFGPTSRTASRPVRFARFSKPK